jgi:WD40 repeat protein
VYALEFDHAVQRLAISSDGTEESRRLRIHAIPSGELLHDLRPFTIASAAALAFAPDGKTIYFEDNRRGIVAWDIDAAKPRFLSPMMAYRVNVLTVSPDGQSVYVADADGARIIEASTGRTTKSLPVERYNVQAANWFADNDLAVVTAEGMARRLDLRDDIAIRRIPYDVWCFETTYSRDGNLLCVTGGMGSRIDTFDSATLERLGSFICPTPGTRIRAVEFLSDNRTLVAGCADGFIRVIDGFTGELLRQTFVRPSEIYALAVDAQESIVVTGHWDRSTNIFDLRSGEHVCSLPILPKRVEGLAFSPDGSQLVISGHNKALALWDLAKREFLPTIETSTMPWSVAFSPDGRTLYATTQNGTLDAIDWPTRVLRATVQGHQRLAPGLAVSPDGKYIATAGEEGLINLWDSQTLRTVVTFKPGISIVVSLAFSPDSNSLAATGAARESVVYDLRAHDQRVREHVPFFRARYAP